MPNASLAQSCHIQKKSCDLPTKRVGLATVNARFGSEKAQKMLDLVQKYILCIENARLSSRLATKMLGFHKHAVVNAGLEKCRAILQKVHNTI